MHGDLVLVALVLVLGCAAFCVGVVYLVCSFFAFLGRSMVSLFCPARRAGWVMRHPLDRRVAVCPNPKCGAVEHRAARYCPYCGTMMHERGQARTA